jgi:ribonucleotide monophosphatase NagD (HAD superfamily)
LSKIQYNSIFIKTPVGHAKSMNPLNTKSWTSEHQASEISPMIGTKSHAPWLDQAKNLIVDLDGTLIREDEALDGASELLERFRKRYVIVSNNSTHTTDGLVARLRRLGLEVEPERVILAGEQTIRFMAERHANARIKLIASEADFVVLALDQRFNYRELESVANQINEGARLVVTNDDSSHPGRGGKLIPETGALMHAVIGCSKVVPYLVVGKPGNMLFEEGLKRLGADPKDTIMIGDNPLTDAVGAARLGMPYLLVGAAPEADAPSLALLFKTNCPGHLRAPEPIIVADDYRCADRFNTA